MAVDVEKPPRPFQGDTEGELVELGVTVGRREDEGERVFLAVEEEEPLSEALVEGDFDSPDKEGELEGEGEVEGLAEALAEREGESVEEVVTVPQLEGEDSAVTVLSRMLLPFDVADAREEGVAKAQGEGDTVLVCVTVGDAVRHRETLEECVLVGEAVRHRETLEECVLVGEAERHRDDEGDSVASEGLAMAVGLRLAVARAEADSKAVGVTVVQWEAVTEPEAVVHTLTVLLTVAQPLALLTALAGTEMEVVGLGVSDSVVLRLPELLLLPEGLELGRCVEEVERLAREAVEAGEGL